MNRDPILLRPLLRSNESVPSDRQTCLRSNLQTGKNVVTLIILTLTSLLVIANLCAFNTVYGTKWSNEACKLAKFRCDLDVCLTEVEDKDNR